MKKLLSFFLFFTMVLSLTACGKGASKGFEIPDVFGIDYKDAVSILEAEGFEVKTIETSVEGISEKLLYPLENVHKGVVFKVDDYIIDNLGNLTKGYDVFYEGDFISEDKRLVVYYAKEDYVLNNEDNTTISTSASENKDTTAPTTTTTAATAITTTTPKDDTTLDPEFKAAMDSYEAFMNEYVSFMKKYSANPTDLTLLAEYADYMSKYADFMEDFQKWENEDMNTAELAYYIDVQARVNKKLLEIAS